MPKGYRLAAIVNSLDWKLDTMSWFIGKIMSQKTHTRNIQRAKFSDLEFDNGIKTIIQWKAFGRHMPYVIFVHTAV